MKKIGSCKIIAAIIALIIPFVLWLMWGSMVEGETQQFELSSISLSEFIKVLMGKGEVWQSTAAQNYVTAIGTTNITTSYIQLSYVQGIVLFVGLAWLVWWVFRKRLVKKEMIFIVGLLVLGAIGYAVTMMVLYTSSFGPDEGPRLASYDRYMGTYLMILMLTIVMIVIWQATELRKRKIIYAMALILIVINSPAAGNRLYPMIKHRGTIYDKYATIADELKNVVGEETKVFLVTQKEGPVRGYQFFLQYYATPISLDWPHQEIQGRPIASWPVNKEADAEEFYEGIEDDIEKHDYLYVSDVDEIFKDKYCKVLKICPVVDGNVYRIVKDENGEIIKYEYVDKVKYPY